DEENSSMSATYNPSKPDLSLIAEYVAFAAAGGSKGASARVGALGGLPPVPGDDLPNCRLDLVGIQLQVFGAGGFNLGRGRLLNVGQSLGVGNPNAGRFFPANNTGALFLAGQPVPEGWIVAPRDGVGISAAQVAQIINAGILQANQTRAAI